MPTPLQLFFTFISLAVASASYAEDGLDLSSIVREGGVRVERLDGTPVIKYRDSSPFVPASILKIATAYCALEELGSNFRFQTDFLTNDGRTLYIRGSGDPGLVSEVLNGIAAELSKVVQRVDSIVIDTSFFSDNLTIDGSERSSNPYDAKNSAFVGNFSSAALMHRRSGEIVSTEPQTPLTPIAKRAGLRLAKGASERINLSAADWRAGAIYGGELLAEFLRRRGVSGERSPSLGSVPKNAKVIYSYRSERPLSEMVKGMLEYSTNFTANQIFLSMGALKLGGTATVDKGQRVMRECLISRVGWRDFHIEEGSGLSRRNKVTASQMTQLLERFNSYRELLPEREGFLAKTGSLRGVNSLAGYFLLEPRQETVRFSIIINREVPHMYKYKVANTIRDYLNRQRLDESLSREATQ
jgi:D-alanyl-D-alanine carboxypeptidase/D-alanyl-D-alanine-endopeptidase (penicillin-binding protein 4)